MKNKRLADWILRVVKGMFIGSGFILPGVSGGALAAVFGIYEQMISFLANITKDFKKNVMYFLPVGIGGVLGVFLLSFVVSFLLGEAEVQILWFFVGCIVGTIPALWKQAGKKGRKVRHVLVVIITAIVSYMFLRYGESFISGTVALNFGSWLIAGAIMALGIIVPGLSSSNFLVYLNMYKPMTDGIKALDFGVIIPIGIGGLLCVIAFSKLMNYIFQRAYTGLFHVIIGIVLSSTVMIIPLDHNYLNVGTIVCLILFGVGYLLAAWMSELDERYRPES